MLSLYNEGATSSSLNSARSALSFFLSYEFNLKDDITITRLFKFFYKKRPLRAKYFTFWPVKSLLDYLAKLHPPSNLNLKDLTLKTLALVALTSSDRGQTIQKMDISNATISEDNISFVIFDTLKHTRRVLKPKVVKCISSETPSLNVKDYVISYIKRTEGIRANYEENGQTRPTQLFISWQTKKAVTTQTLSRWLKSTLGQAGIDVQQFSAHSIRGAGLSSAYNHGANIKQIVESGSWTNTGTFLKHYLAPESNSPVGKIILKQYG